MQQGPGVMEEGSGPPLGLPSLPVALRTLMGLRQEQGSWAGAGHGVCDRKWGWMRAEAGSAGRAAGKQGWGALEHCADLGGTDREGGALEPPWGAAWGESLAPGCGGADVRVRVARSGEGQRSSSHLGCRCAPPNSQPGTYLMAFFSLRPRPESGVPTVSKEFL